MEESMDEGVKINGNGSSVPTIGRTRTPKVSIGLPVYNGEPYLRESIESVLAQDFEDFELLISDNASTDGTWEICQEYAVRDNRVRIHRHDENRGAVFNFEYVFRNTTAPYFMWQAHDDLMDPTYVRRCYDFMVQAPEYVLCHAITVFIDEQERCVRQMEGDDSVTDNTPIGRYRTFLSRGGSRHVYGIYGMIRRGSLAQIDWTSLRHVGGDRLVLVQLMFLGKFHRIPMRLKFFRMQLTPSYQRQRQPSTNDAMLFGPRTRQRIAPSTNSYMALLAYGLSHPSLSIVQRVSYILHTVRYYPPTHPLRADILRPILRLASKTPSIYHSLEWFWQTWERLWSIGVR